MLTDNPHYQAITEFYGNQRTKRTGVLYRQHIDEGLVVLDLINAPIKAREAYCLHPIVQGDTELRSAFLPGSVLYRYPIDMYAVALAMEYRSVANAYLSHHIITDVNQIQLSPLPEVQLMLIADKVQNRKDFERHHQTTHPRAQELSHYFQQWLTRLWVSEADYQHFVHHIIAHSTNNERN